MRALSALLLVAALLAGCDERDQNATSSTEPDPNPRIDADPTPPSGTGGGTEAVSPDGTSSSTGKAVPNQPTPTD